MQVNTAVLAALAAQSPAVLETLQHQPFFKSGHDLPSVHGVPRWLPA